jgi:hypothetical protein
MRFETVAISTEYSVVRLPEGPGDIPPSRSPEQ